MEIMKRDLKIGMALSGGGVRASVFHLGVLARIAADNLLENVTFISTVSGGTLITGLIYSTARNMWPTSEFFLHHCLKQTKYYLTEVDVKSNVIFRSLTRPWHLLQGRAKVVAQSMHHRWGLSGSLNDIPLEPRWVLNATTYETGRNWRFIPQKRMGDYIANYVKEPDIPLADAMAASAAYPGLIGPLLLNTEKYKWFKYENGNEVSAEPPFKRLHLWDGGLYDNLGVEPLFKIRGKTYCDEVNFLIVSDASPGVTLSSHPFLLWQRAFRLVGIVMDQVRGLRARTLVDHFEHNKNCGVYLKMGNPGRKILADAGITEERIKHLTSECLSHTHVQTAVNFPTTLRRLSKVEFDLLYQHGWEVANCTLHSRCPTLFDYLEYRPASPKFMR
jgi:NTE family protein